MDASKLSIVRTLIYDYLESHDMFWFNVMLIELNIDTKSELYYSFVIIIRELLDNETIICCDKKGKHRQYMKL